MEMLLGSASVMAYQDRPGLSCAILSPTGSDPTSGGKGGKGGAIPAEATARFQEDASRFPFNKNVKDCCHNSPP